MSALVVHRDNRDPLELGETLLRLQEVESAEVTRFDSDEPERITTATLRETYDANTRLLNLVPDTVDASPVEKYGDPRTYTVKIHTWREVIRRDTPTEKLAGAGEDTCRCGRALDADGEHDGGYGAWCG